MCLFPEENQQPVFGVPTKINEKKIAKVSPFYQLFFLEFCNHSTTTTTTTTTTHNDTQRQLHNNNHNNMRLVGFIAFWGWLAMVVLVMVLSIFSLPVLLRLVSGGTLLLLLGLGLVCLFLVTLLVLFSIILDAWRCRVAAGLCGWAGFRSGPLLDCHGSL